MSIKQYTIVIILSVLIVSNGLSALNAAEVTRVVSGFGVTKKESVDNALLEAIQQVKGLKIAGTEQMHSSFVESSSTHNKKHYSSSSAKSFFNQDVMTQTQGLIKSYEILSTVRSESDQVWEVRIRVHIPVYKTPGISPHSRRKIAIIPFRTTRSSYNFRGGHSPSSEISRQFTQKLVTEMTQTRRFTVLDREYMEELLREKNLILSLDAPLFEQMKIGQVLGVDYLLIGTISEANQKQIPYTIQVTGETGYNFSASFIADYRIIVMATRQIKWAANVTLSLGNDELKILVPSLRGDLIQQALLHKAAKQVVQKVMDNIYPIRVVKVQSNGHLILNQGGVTVSDGEILDVFTKGKKVIDPYTKESLGSAESWVATIRITRVTAKMSYAQVIKGQLSEISEGSICRRQSQAEQIQKKVPSGRTTDVESISGGGVILPFD